MARDSKNYRLLNAGLGGFQGVNYQVDPQDLPVSKFVDGYNLHSNLIRGTAMTRTGYRPYEASLFNNMPWIMPWPDPSKTPNNPTIKEDTEDQITRTTYGYVDPERKVLHLFVTTYPSTMLRNIEYDVTVTVKATGLENAFDGLNAVEDYDLHLQPISLSLKDNDGSALWTGESICYGCQAFFKVKFTEGTGVTSPGDLDPLHPLASSWDVHPALFVTSCDACDPTKYYFITVTLADVDKMNSYYSNAPADMNGTFTLTFHAQDATSCSYYYTDFGVSSRGLSIQACVNRAGLWAAKLVALRLRWYDDLAHSHIDVNSWENASTSLPNPALIGCGAGGLLHCRPTSGRNCPTEESTNPYIIGGYCDPITACPTASIGAWIE